MTEGGRQWIGGIHQIHHQGRIHQIQRREAVRSRYHPDQIYDPNNPWIQRRSWSPISTSTSPPHSTKVANDSDVVKNANGRGLDGQGEITTVTKAAESTRTTRIATNKFKATTPDILEATELDQSTQSWRTYFPLPEKTSHTTGKPRATRWPNWVTQHDRPTTSRPQTLVTRSKQVTKWPNWVTPQDRPSRRPQWVSQSDRPGQESADGENQATEKVTQWSRTSSGGDQFVENGKTSDTTRRSWNSEVSSTESSFHSPDLARWRFVLMRRPGAEPPSFSSSFYKDKDLRLVGEEENEGFRVAEGQQGRWRGLTLHWEKGHQFNTKTLKCMHLPLLVTACPFEKQFFSCSCVTFFSSDREYRCLGAWEEDGLLYTYTRRTHNPRHECFVGRVTISI